jgi:hypothetical protein
VPAFRSGALEAIQEPTIATFGGGHGPGAQVARPCPEPLNEEDFLRQAQVALDRRLRKAEFVPQRGCYQQLPGSCGQERDEGTHQLLIQPPVGC